MRKRPVVNRVMGAISPKKRSASELRVASFAEVARRISVRSSLEIASALSNEREHELAFAMLDSILGRYPRSSRVLTARAVMRTKIQSPGGLEDFVAACRGDLRDVDLEHVAVNAALILDLNDLISLRQVIYLEADPEVATVATALNVLDVVIGYRKGESIKLGARERLPAQLLLGLARWSREDFRWDVLDELVGELEDRESLGDRLNTLRAQLASYLRVKGDLKRSLELVRPVLARVDHGRAATLVAENESDLRLLREGWVAPQKMPLEDSTNGSLAYLVHNSLPYSSSGYATRTQGLLASMVRRGWNVDVLTRPQYPLDTKSGAKIRSSVLETPDVIDGVSYSRILSRADSSDIDTRVTHFAARVAEKAERERWGLVHAASNFYVGLAGVEAAARIGVPSVYEVRGIWDITRASREPAYFDTERFKLAIRMEADACRLADHSFAITEGLRSLMIDSGVPADQISLLPNGVDINRFTPATPNEGLRQKLGLDGKIVVGYVGSVLDYEGLELLVDAVKVLLDDGLPVALLIVGDGKAFDSVKSRIEEVGISEHVVLPGRVPHAEAEAYYSIIDIAPFPRLPLPVTELVSPLKPFEAMAMAKPVVVSSVGALTEIVTDGENGLVFTKGDVSSLAVALARLVDSEEERVQLGAAGRDWVVANRSWDALSARIVEVYEKLGVPFPTK